VTKRIAFLAAEGLSRLSSPRRDSIAQYDKELDALEPAFAAEGLELVETEWRRWDGAGADGVLVLAAWDYQDDAEGFLSLLRRLGAQGVPVFNPPDLVAWNIRKTYLRELADRGVRTVPTLWPEAPSAADVEAAFAQFGCEEVVLKRQVGAGAKGQRRIRRGEARLEGGLLDRPGMIQPFLPMIVEEGEWSFLFVEGELSHVVVKRAAPGDYRIQPRYGGVSQAVEPIAVDLAAAKAVLGKLDAPPLYARVDMVRADDGALMLMELELIEPYLFPDDGPRIGAMLARALKRRLG
jgi:glutathione synthase/RimK-type ligase-like ATP-grasp enzyme